MKTDKMLTGLAIILFIALGLLSAQFFQQQMASEKNMKALQHRVDKLDTAYQNVETQGRVIAETLKVMDSKVVAGDAERKDLTAKIEAMTKDIQELQGSVKSALAPPVSTTPPVSEKPAPEPPKNETAMSAQSLSTVELGNIPVEKSS